jgi:hypothetical protein
MPTNYNILELQKMDHAQLVEVCNEMQPTLVSTHKQHMIYAILERQQMLNYKPANETINHPQTTEP